MIHTINEELLKSAELTGLWEKKLRQIEKGTYEAKIFLEELKQLVNQIVVNVFSDPSSRSITIREAVKEEPVKEKKEKKPRKTRAKKEPAEKKEKEPVPLKPVCPRCKKGDILRGKTAYGCSAYKDGCTFRMEYSTYGEGLSDEQLIAIISTL